MKACIFLSREFFAIAIVMTVYRGSCYNAVTYTVIINYAYHNILMWTTVCLHFVFVTMFLRVF